MSSVVTGDFFKPFYWYSNHIWVLWWHLVTFKLCKQLTASPIHFLVLEICANYTKTEHYHSILYFHRFFYIFEGFFFVCFFFLLGFILRTLKWDTIGCHALPVGFRPFVKLESLVWNHCFWTDHLQDLNVNICWKTSVPRIIHFIFISTKYAMVT